MSKFNQPGVVTEVFLKGSCGLETILGMKGFERRLAFPADEAELLLGPTQVSSTRCTYRLLTSNPQSGNAE